MKKIILAITTLVISVAATASVSDINFDAMRDHLKKQLSADATIPVVQSEIDSSDHKPDFGAMRKHLQKQLTGKPASK